MDVHGLFLKMKMKDVLKEARVVINNKNGRAYKYELVILFARVWFLKAEIFVQRSSTPMMTTTEDFLKGIHEGCRFLQKSFSQQLEKAEDQILKLIEQVPGQVESLYRSSQSGEWVGNRLKDLLYKFLVQVMLFKSEMLLLELLRSKIGVVPDLENQIGSLREGLIFLIKSDINQPKEDTADEKLILADFEVLAAGVISLCNSGPADIDTVNNRQFQLSDLLVKVELLKAKLTDLYFQKLQLNFPKTHGLRNIEILLKKFKEVLSHGHHSLACVTHQIGDIHRDLEFIMLKYRHIFTEQSRNQEAIDIRTRLVDAVYHVQHGIESMEIVGDPSSQQLMWLYHFSREIIYVKDQLPVIGYSEINTYDVGGQTSASRSIRTSVLHLSSPSIQQITVGYDHERLFITNQLCRGSRKLDVVGITGMAGVGKTTLAYTVFKSSTIRHHFHIHAWCYVSQTYQMRDLLLNLLNQITPVRDDMLAVSDDYLRERLYFYLKGRRYLIVLDDVWSSQVLDDFRRLFPDDATGSRILITGQVSGVVPNPVPLGGLSDDESWALLTRIVFEDKKFPEELLKSGRQIAKICRGLPIAIRLVAGLLIGKDKDEWNEIAKSGTSQIVNDQISQSMEIVELSYQYLPYHLQECFLYLGVFPKDEDISVRRLLWLWNAEEFLDNEQFMDLEDAAEGHLTNLIESSLVIAAKKGSNGKVKTCRVHSQVINFCLSKGTDTKFSQLISDGIQSEHFNPSNVEQYRLSICGDPEHFIASTPSGPYLQSLLFFGSNELYPGCDSDVSFICNKFKLLKVLDLESVNVGNTLENGIQLPVHLRYLAVGGDMNSLPSSLSKLHNLRILVVRGLMNSFTLPDTIWSMTNLRHIRVINHCIFTLENDKNGSNSMLDGLVSLSLPSFSYVKETVNILRRLRNLRELKCILLEPRIGSMQVCQFPELGCLWHLQSLKLSYSGRPLKSSVEWNLPTGLRELTLSNFRLPWNQISAIGRLPNLEVLKLNSRAFEGSDWEMREGEFGRLRYLKLDSLNIICWSADDEALPVLEQLVLRHCKLLEEIPSCLGYIPTLERIEVHQCTASVEDSVRNIVEEFGNEVLISIFS